VRGEDRGAETPEFPRLRIGIGRPAGIEADDVVDYVLEPFTEDESRELPRILTSAAEGVRTFARDGIAAAMNRMNASAPHAPEPPRGDA
jgi:PTH1 family peptidyl-tRNA hydrolase